MSLFSPEIDTCLSATLRSAPLCFFCSLQPDNFIFLSERSRHSLIQFTSFVTILNDSFTQSRFGRLEHVEGMIIRSHALHSLYQNRRWEDLV